MDLSAEQTFAQPLSNQIQNLPSTSAAPGMINQHQMSANMSFGGSGTANNNNFSMTNILNTQMNEMDANSLLTQSSGGLNQMDNNNIQITPIINASMDNLQMQQQQLQRNVMNGPNMHVDIAITSANNWYHLPSLLRLRNEW